MNVANYTAGADRHSRKNSNFSDALSLQETSFNIF